jgi:glutathione S-transferase
VKLYNLKAGMNTRRVRIFLAEKGISIPVVEIDLAKGESRSTEFLKKNSMGKLPVLECDDGTIVSESIAICRYFEELQPEPNLFGATQGERAAIEMWNRRMEFELVMPMAHQFGHLSPFFAGRAKQFSDYGEAARAHALRTLSWLDSELATRKYIAGDRYTVADISAQCAIVLGKNTGAPMPEGLPNLARWWADVASRPTARA